MSEVPTTEAERMQSIRTRLVEIENELFSEGSYRPTDILRPPNPQARIAHEQRFETLRKERESLLAQLPPTGEASGMHLVLGKTLGTTIVRESENDYRPDPRDEHADHPMWRFAAEQGWGDLD